MLDRDGSPSYQRVEKKLVEKDIANVKKTQFYRLSELHESLRSIYVKALRYKNSEHTPGKHIEFTTDFHRFQTEKLCRAYAREFEDVIFIHLHRDFMGWAESIASQRFSNPRKRHRFFLHELHKRHFEYESRINGCAGLHLDFESLFLPNTWQAIEHVSEALGEPVPDIPWENEIFDLYGQIRNFETTFTRADYEGKYLSSITRRIIKLFIGNKSITYFHDAIVYFFYLIDSLRFLANEKRH